VRGKLAGEAAAVYENAIAFEKAGAFSVLLECVPTPVAQAVTRALAVPTIGIGAGRYCDGQVLVFHDMAGLFTKFKPRFVKRYFDADSGMREAAKKYVKEVRSGAFPKPENEFGMDVAEQKGFFEKI
jgi:3-methyl-2-oxobutanoate hydroxymethyltransferase